MKRQKKLGLNTLRRSLLFPDQREEVDQEDELVVALSREVTQKYFGDVRKSKWSAPDRRHKNKIINFNKSNFLKDYFLLQKVIWKYGISAPKVKVVNRKESLAKLVVFLCLKAKGSLEFLLFPRANKRILPDVFTLGFMKSLTVESLELPFRSALTANRLFAASPSHISFDNVFGHIDIKIDDIPLCGEEGLFPNIPYVNDSDMLECGIVAGGKDIGLVYLLEYDQGILERIAYEAGGIIFEAEDYTYEDVSQYYKLGKDGWSEAVLMYVLSKM